MDVERKKSERTDYFCDVRPQAAGSGVEVVIAAACLPIRSLARLFHAPEKLQSCSLSLVFASQLSNAQ
jgi:hypothetical protein